MRFSVSGSEHDSSQLMQEFSVHAWAADQTIFKNKHLLCCDVSEGGGGVPAEALHEEGEGGAGQVS